MRPLHLIICLILAIHQAGALIGCCSRPTPANDSKPLPDATTVLKRWNDRAARLDRLWGRVAVTFRFTDEDGDRRFEQGEGHFQLRNAHELALSVGKLSEIMLWIGADADRYWLIERFEQRRVWFGRHEAFSREKAERLGLPVAPHEILTLMGLAPFTLDANPSVTRTKTGDLVLTVADPDHDPALAIGSWRATLNPISYLPIRVERLGADGSTILIAEHTMVTPTIIRYENSSDFDHIAEAIRIAYPSRDASLTINFAGELTDGRRTNRLKDSAFDLQTLIDLLGPMDTIIDLDDSSGSPGDAP